MTGADDLRQQALRGAAYLAARYLASAVLKLVGVFVIARQLGPAGYGSYVAAFAIVQFPFAAAQAGLAARLLRDETCRPEAPALLLLLAAGAMLPLWLAAPALGAHSGIDGLANIVALLALALPLQFGVLPATAALERRLAYREIALIELGGQLLFYAVAITLIVLGLDPSALAIGFIAQHAGQTVAAWRLSDVRLRITVDGRAMRAMIADAWTLSAAHAVFSLRLLVAPLLVAPVLGAHAIGVIGMTVAIVETLAGLKTVAWRMSLSLAARLGDQRDRLAHAIRQGRDGQVLLLGALLLAAGLAIETVVPLLFGPRWGEVARLYPFVALAMLVNAAAAPRLALLAMTDRDRMVLFANAAHIALFATACALLCPRFGLLGYGLGELIALGVYALVAFGPAAAHSGDEGRGFGLVWTVAIGLSLFWRDIGVWALAMPAVALPVLLAGVRQHHRRARPA